MTFQYCCASREAKCICPNLAPNQLTNGPLLPLTQEPVLEMVDRVFVPAYSERGAFLGRVRVEDANGTHYGYLLSGRPILNPFDGDYVVSRPWPSAATVDEVMERVPTFEDDDRDDPSRFRWYETEAYVEIPFRGRPCWENIEQVRRPFRCNPKAPHLLIRGMEAVLPDLDLDRQLLKERKSSSLRVKTFREVTKVGRKVARLTLKKAVPVITKAASRMVNGTEKGDAWDNVLNKVGILRKSDLKDHSDRDYNHRR